MTTNIKVVSFTNLGAEASRTVATMEEASSLAKIYRVPSNHMVAIEAGGTRVHRWDRDRVVGENKWRSVDPDEMETLGPIREVHRAP